MVMQMAYMYVVTIYKDNPDSHISGPYLFFIVDQINSLGSNSHIWV